MANTAKQDSKGKNIFKLSLAVLVLVLLGIFLYPGTYNVIKKHFVKNSGKYLEMDAYAKSKPLDKKYFVLQGNDVAKSFVEDQANFVNETGLKSLNCPSQEMMLIYEKPTKNINDYVKKEGGEVFTLNPNTNIQFFAAIIKSKGGACKI